MMRDTLALVRALLGDIELSHKFNKFYIQYLQKRRKNVIVFVLL